MTQKPEGNESESVESPPSEGTIPSFLRRVRRRLVADRVLNFLCTDLLVGLSLVAAAILLDRLLLPGLYRWELVAVVLGLSIACTIVRMFAWGKLSLFHTAVEADRRLGLSERVSSACYTTHDFDSSGEGGSAPDREWASLVLQDAGRSLEGISVSESFPVKPRRRALWLVVPVVVGAALALWVPSYDPFGLVASDPPEDALVKKAMAEEKKKLDKELEELLKKAEKEDSEEARKLLKLLAEQTARKETPSSPSNPEKAQGKKGEKNSAQKTALLELARRENVLKKGVNQEKFQALKKALKELQGLQVKSAQHTRALQAALKDGDFAKAKRELDALKKKLADLSKKKPSELTKEEKELLKKLQEELARLSRDAGGLGQLAPNLSTFGGSLGAADLQQMLDNMDQFAMDLDALAKLSNDLDFLNQALQMIQLSKQDLAQLAQHKCPNCGKKLGKSGGT